MRIASRSFIRLLVNAHDLGKRIALHGLSIQQIFPAVNDHTELRAPVANVVIADYLMPEESRDPRQRVTKHGAADVTDVHRFVYVR